MICAPTWSAWDSSSREYLRNTDPAVICMPSLRQIAARASAEHGADHAERNLRHLLFRRLLGRVPHVDVRDFVRHHAGELRLVRASLDGAEVHIDRDRPGSAKALMSFSSDDVKLERISRLRKLFGQL